MSQAPDFTQTVSLRLSEVLADIGVNVRLVKKKRGAWLLAESIHTASKQLDDIDIGTRYYFGSRSEGTTTPGLQSDTDRVHCINQIKVINSSEMERGNLSYLMIEDESVSPGYCLLEEPTSGDPSPIRVLDKFHYIETSGRILLKKTIAYAIPATARAEAERCDERAYQVFRHGPAAVLTVPILGMSQDDVLALKCKSWPLEARQWLDQQGVGQWPSDDMRRDCGNTSCFVVAVGRKGSKYEELEWRISTSLAERHLMFSLNITQIRCYVLMKMLIKTYIKPYYEDAITSYMCKTVLFHSIASTHPNFWSKSNLIPCLLRSLLILYNCVLNENCPHFIIPGNNLMAGHVVHESKPDILEKLQSIISSVVTALLRIECDDLGTRLNQKLGFVFPSKLGDNHITLAEPSIAIAQIIGMSLNSCLESICDCRYKSATQTLQKYTNSISNQGLALDQKACVLLTLGFLTTKEAVLAGITQNCDRISTSSICNCSYESTIQTLLKYMFKLNSISNQGSALDQKACSLLTPWFYTTLGSVLASHSIQKYNRISANALGWISMGLDTDVSSGKLKKASMFYCAGDCQETEILLRDIEKKYDLNKVEPICNCYVKPFLVTTKFAEESNNHNEEALQYIAAFCVRYLPYEIHCVPHELKYEMFRSTKYDLSFRGPAHKWMDFAVADSLPYLYFLQYKTYYYLGKQDDKQRALSNLIRTINQEPNLGHRETALNLLGQCMEGEDRTNDALNCYLLSLSLRGRNNAAIIHICRLISKLVNDQARI
ncbi:uncharacterized protein LOC128554452 [Mercenaria mercenaria]|uniref:uncharacterized protein LOC128554452 n=1 Tax=Mercenaria mercenaria TaxID=6596 RepID=UPI00234F5DB7|nr:uncharacterized protein LOC128554452 [Mercenaria mercenaria]